MELTDKRSISNIGYRFYCESLLAKTEHAYIVVPNGRHIQATTLGSKSANQDARLVNNDLVTSAVAKHSLVLYPIGMI